MKKSLLIAAALTFPTMAMGASAQTVAYVSSTGVQPIASSFSSSEAGAEQQAVKASIERLLSAQSGQDGISAAAWHSARAAYAQGMFAPIWNETAARALANVSQDLKFHGLKANASDAAIIEQLAQTRFNGRSAEQIASADIALTRMWLRAAQAVAGELSSEGSAAYSSTTAPSLSSLTEALLLASNGDPFGELDSVAPSHPQYIALKAELGRYIAMQERGSFAKIIGEGVVQPGESSPQIVALKRRLRAGRYLRQVPTGDPAQEQYFDEATHQALKALQRDNGAEDDGVLGPQTRAMLNRGLDVRIERIADSMQKWRDLGDPGERFIWANVPSFSAEAWEDGTRALSMRTVVGSPTRKTPIFSDTIEYVVANPKWYAPTSIVERDKIPRLLKDPGYATRNGYYVYDRNTGDRVSPYSVNWGANDAAQRYQLVQQEGDNNALGKLKIIFPNEYAVYLHGTPADQLFERNIRAFSSGCIRLERPVEMAKWLVGFDADGKDTQLQRALAGEDTERVNLKAKTPVHITYMTVTVGDDGRAVFWKDLYERAGGTPSVTLSTASERNLSLSASAGLNGRG